MWHYLALPSLAKASREKVNKDKVVLSCLQTASTSELPGSITGVTQPLFCIQLP